MVRFLPSSSSSSLSQVTQKQRLIEILTQSDREGDEAGLGIGPLQAELINVAFKTLDFLDSGHLTKWRATTC